LRADALIVPKDRVPATGCSVPAIARRIEALLHPFDRERHTLADADA
jgi:hypothetical protein